MGVEKLAHPYFPRDLHLPHYKPNEKEILELLVPFFGFVAVVIGLTWLYTGREKHMQTLQRMKMCWFMACGLIHSVLEGYFALFHKTLAGEQTFLAQIWKEYGKGDSRYISSDPFTVCMESITAFVDGPLSFIALYAFITRAPYRHVTQILLSLCQLYGDVLYFSTEVFEGFSHGEAYHPLYFWFYFVFMNAIWIVVPLLCIWESYQELSRAQALTDRTTARVLKKKQ